MTYMKNPNIKSAQANKSQSLANLLSLDTTHLVDFNGIQRKVNLALNQLDLTKKKSASDSESADELDKES